MGKILLVVCVLVASASSRAAAAEPDEAALAREIYAQLVEINTTDSVGDNTAAAEAMAKRLGEAGFPEADLKLIAPHARKGNLVARLRGAGKRKPLLSNPSTRAATSSIAS
jgi:acetylornithine deacetylase/succinyl-diaminopimelate desuccinylase-like protein